MAHLPVARGVFTWPGDPRLIAGKCRSCATVTFPRQAGCPYCTGRDVAEYLLPTEGTLWSWTVQAFQPKPPYRGRPPFQPYGVGYVEFAGDCIVEGRLTTADPDDLVIGRRMRLTLIPFADAEDGSEIVTYAFEPVGDTA